MRYYAVYDSDNNVVAIGTGDGDIEITKEEYDIILSQIYEKIELEEQLYNNEIVINDIPIEWQKEIQDKVDKRIALEEQLLDEEITHKEFYFLVEEVL